MIDFHRVTIADKAWVDPIVAAEDSRSADFNFGNIYMWDGAYHQLVTSLGGRMLTKLRWDRQPFFAFPIGSGPLEPALDALAEFAGQRGYPLAIRGITEEHRAQMEQCCPGRFVFTPDRDNFDYLYLAEKLATMGGKKLHGKRNFCNRFEKTHSWEFRRLTRGLIPACMEMLGQWQAEFDTPPDGLEEEHGAIIRAFMRYDARGL